MAVSDLTLAMRAEPEAGEPLPSPFEGLSALGAFHRRGQVSLVVAASGVGKSAYATHFAVHGQYDEITPVPTLYCAADTDRVTLGVRIASGLLNKPLGDVERSLRTGDRSTWDALAEGTQHIRWHWNPSPSVWDLSQEMQAYAYAQGEWPHLVVVDNLIDVDTEGQAGHEQKDWVMAELKKLASESDAHVMVLHHAVGMKESGNEVIEKRDILDKVAKRPRLVLTIHRPSGTSLLRISVVKNSMGPAAGDGSLYTDVAFMPERMWLRG